MKDLLEHLQEEHLTTPKVIEVILSKELASEPPHVYRTDELAQSKFSAIISSGEKKIKLEILEKRVAGEITT
ncbi:MAG: hypothetical protein ACJ72Q_20140 [Nitrososphaeraceae archaeon]